MNKNTTEQGVKTEKREKKSQNAFRLSTKLCINIGVIAILCLTLLAYMQNRDTTSLNKKSTINNIYTALSAQNIILEEFIVNSEDQLKTFAQSGEIKALLKNPDEHKNVDAAQNYLDAYYKVLDGWEGLYAADWTSTQLAHCTRSAIGKAFRTEPDALKAWQDSMLESDTGLVNQGVFVSPSTGKMLLNMRMIIYDSDGKTPIGAVGGGPFISVLSDKLKEYRITGLDNVSYTILDNDKNLYVIDSNEDNVGKEVEDSLMLDIINAVNSGDLSGEIETDTDLICYKKFDKLALVLTAKIPLSDIRELSRELSNRLVIYCVLTLVLVLIGIFCVSARATRPLTNLAEATKTLAGGYIETPIDVKCYVKETLQIKEASIDLQNALKQLRRHLLETADSLSDNAHLTHTICASSEDSTEFISSAMKNLTNSVNSMEESVQTLKDEMADIEGDVNHIGLSINALSESSDSMDRISEQAMADINEVYTSSEKSVTAANEISEKMSELNRAIEEVSKASEIIASISSQTSLLSLNASIEAARAGEMGKGFAVVADEIGKLAAQSDQSTKQIDVVITRMQELAKISVDAAENIKDIILSEQDIVKQTQNSFTELKSQIDGSIDQISQISEANKRLTTSKDSAIQSVDILASISEENASSNEKVNDSLSGLNENVTLLYGKTEGMSQMADKLGEVINVFKD